MICKHCGKENADGSTFCLNCGAMLRDDAEDVGETTVLGSDASAYEGVAQEPQYVKQNNFTQPSGQWGSAPQPNAQNQYAEPAGKQNNFTQPQAFQVGQVQAGAAAVKPEKKKLGKGAIIGIVIAAIVVVSLAGFGISRAVRLHNAEQAIEDIELPDTDWVDDVDSDLEQNSQNEFSFGSVTDGVYSNMFADIEFKKPNDSWEFMTKEEIYSHYSEMDNVFLDDETQETYYEDTTTLEKTYYDMFLYNEETNEYATVMMSDGNGADVSLEEFVDQIDSYAESSYGVHFTSNDDVYLSGNTYKSFSATVESANKDISVHFLVTKIGDHFVTIALNVEKSDATADEILNKFVNQ